MRSTGIVFTGGDDLDPELLRRGAHTRRPSAYTGGATTPSSRSSRARFKRDMPVLGICRGIQVMNVGLGGDLHQHLPDVVGHEGHKNDPPGQFLEHEVAIRRETRLSLLLGERSRVMSHHHQGIRRIGDGLIEGAHAEDGALEALEAPGHQFFLGVLWHPEVSADSALSRLRGRGATIRRGTRRGLLRALGAIRSEYFRLYSPIGLFR